MPLVEQELLILPEKMSSPKVLMGFILLDLQFPVSWEGGGGGKSPPKHIITIEMKITTEIKYCCPKLIMISTDGI
jgi:hypothetical protein